jgi:hypothetical protein
MENIPAAKFARVQRKIYELYQTDAINNAVNAIDINEAIDIICKLHDNINEHIISNSDSIKFNGCLKELKSILYLINIYSINAICDSTFYDMQQKSLDIFVKKNADYGNVYEKYGYIGILIRINDKIGRCLSIRKNNIISVTDETLNDTLLDLSNYCILCVMTMN